MSREMTARNLERKIKITFLENHGLTPEDEDWDVYIDEFIEDYEEYRDWFMTCCA